jgi:hypothetical protein
MKNIHVLPTDKPSRVHFDCKLFISTNPQISREINSIVKGRNIYITNDEEIKEGDWYVNTLDEVVRKNNTINHSYHKKIILTTDTQLIKDGVQTIDDEFLEWFVKNPSCEEVETEKWFDTSHIDLGYGSKVYHNNPNIPLHKIIIPKEEPKQAIIDMMKADEELGLYEQIDQDNPVLKGSTTLVKKETKELNPYIGPFLLNNGFEKREDNIYTTSECTTIIVNKDYYEVQFIEPDLGEVSMYTDSLSIYHLVGILTWFNLIDKNYKK